MRGAVLLQQRGLEIKMGTYGSQIRKDKWKLKWVERDLYDHRMACARWRGFLAPNGLMSGDVEYGKALENEGSRKAGQR